ncbi:MAG: tripartite tricarboxylate transporter substrate binding protein [Betaproteobacteria bacterium]|nr:tripartite tricarboxylate transporter substrate binding protein [Betaproteobacteria bacterium]
MIQTRFMAACLAATAALSPCSVSAQSASDYPVKPVRVVLGFAPGGATDILVRLMSQKLSENMGKSFVVESHPGAGGVLAYALIARSRPDGYALAGVSSGYSVTPVIHAKLPYDPLKDLAPIALVSQSPYLIVVHPSLPVKSVRNLIDLAKAKPGALNAASAGTGSTPHLALEYFKSVVGVNITHVPYKGTGQGLIDLVAGQVHMLFGNIVSVSPHVKSGKLRALAVTAPKRSAAMPGIPNMAEAGVPEYGMTTWFGMMAPAGTPAAIVNRLNAEMVKILKSPDVVERLERDGAEPVGSTPEEFMRLIASEIERWRKIATEAGIRPQ